MRTRAQSRTGEPLGVGLQELPELVGRDASVLQNLGEQPGSDPFALVNREQKAASVVVYQEAVTPAATRLAEARAFERTENPACRKLGEPGHRLCRDDYLDGNQRLAGRLASLLAERVDVELKGSACARDRLASGSAVRVATRHLGHRSDEASVFFPVESDDVAKLHGPEDVRSAVEGQSGLSQMPHPEVERRLSDKVSMCNYWANRLCCEAPDRAMQVHGGIGYSRHIPFEHIYRHHRRYRITEGSEEIQMRKVAGFLFGFMGPRSTALAES